MQIFNPTAHQGTDAILISFYESEEPKEIQYQSRQDRFEADYQEWLLSKKTYPLRKEDEEEMRLLAYREWFCGHIDNDFEEHLAIGINIDALSNWLELKTEYVHSGGLIPMDEVGGIGNQTNEYSYFVLTPLPVVEDETQDSMIYDIIELIEDGFGYETIKSKFTITRNK